MFEFSTLSESEGNRAEGTDSASAPSTLTATQQPATQQPATQQSGRHSDAAHTREKSRSAGSQQASRAGHAHPYGASPQTKAASPLPLSTPAVGSDSITWILQLSNPAPQAVQSSGEPTRADATTAVPASALAVVESKPRIDGASSGTAAVANDAMGHTSGADSSVNFADFQAIDVAANQSGRGTLDEAAEATAAEDDGSPHDSSVYEDEADLLIVRRRHLAPWTLQDAQWRDEALLDLFPSTVDSWRYEATADAEEFWQLDVERLRALRESWQPMPQTPAENLNDAVIAAWFGSAGGLIDLGGSGQSMPLGSDMDERPVFVKLRATAGTNRQIQLLESAEAIALRKANALLGIVDVSHSEPPADMVRDFIASPPATSGNGLSYSMVGFALGYAVVVRRRKPVNSAAEAPQA
ncbi:MAG: hypothetical protein KDA45_04925 [Planctomycetales bacterium]|nr:hypothetical protein [Planctomycetales bacterium]